MHTVICPAPFAFDTLAAGFDRRSGFPEAVQAAVAREVLAGMGPGCFLEIGTGTGEIGLDLARTAPSYLGLDVSLPMLEQARARFGRAGIPEGRLVQAEANRPWPVAAGSVGRVFISRTAHLLDPSHLIAETRRTAHPDGGSLLLGRVCREPGSVRNTLRREMRRLLAEAGIAGRRGEDSHRRLLEIFSAQRCEVIPPWIACAWPVRESPVATLASWGEKPGLAGVALPDATRRGILERLEAWARERYGNLDATSETMDHYELSAVLLGLS